jgi:hypothetical protein
VENITYRPGHCKNAFNSSSINKDDSAPSSFNSCQFIWPIRLQLKLKCHLNKNFMLICKIEKINSYQCCDILRWIQKPSYIGGREEVWLLILPMWDKPHIYININQFNLVFIFFKKRYIFSIIGQTRTRVKRHHISSKAPT